MNVPDSTVPYPVLYTGQITWRYADKSVETFPVPSAVLRNADEISIDCDCGTQRKPYVYNILLRRVSDDKFEGGFSAGPTSNPSKGRATCVVRYFNAGCVADGKWYEDGKECNWIAELAATRTSGSDC